MKQTRLLKTCTLAFAIACVAGFSVTGCAEKNLYDPNYGKQELPAPETFPDFSNWSAINLSVDYEMPGCKTWIEIYTDYPYKTAADGSVVKTEQLPQFAAYTDDNSRYNGKLEFPATTKSVYLCASGLGLPQCLKVEVVNGKIDFKYSDLYQEKPQTRGNNSSPSGKLPYELDSKYLLYSLCQWSESEYGKYGRPDFGYVTKNKAVDASWITSVQSQFWKGKSSKPAGLDNRDLLVDEKYTNVAIAKSFVNKEGTTVTVTSAKVTLTFLAESAWNENTLGYYFYPSNAKPASPDKLKKYILFPNISTPGSVPFNGAEGYHDSDYAPLQNNSQVTLKYINETTGEVSDDFPAEYTIGWFLIPNAFNSKEGKVDTDKTYLYSNESWNQAAKKRCIAVNDPKTGRVIVGFEDGDSDDSCEDVLFFVESNPEGAILDPNKPEIGDDGEIETPDKTYEKRKGTLAFEDNWPAKGDYDMNDVAVTYKQIVTIGHGNKVKKIVDVFTPVQKADAAMNANAFAYQVDASQVGTYELPEGAIYESATHSFILFPNAQKAREKVFTVTRTFDATFDAKDLMPYNPFIIISYIAGSTKRAEVHLPKMPPTSYTDKKLIGAGADAYYIDIDGKHPFALDLPIWEFSLVTEKAKIGTEGEYPDFNLWVEYGCGSAFNDWYMEK